MQRLFSWNKAVWARLSQMLFQSLNELQQKLSSFAAQFPSTSSTTQFELELLGCLDGTTDFLIYRMSQAFFSGVCPFSDVLTDLMGNRIWVQTLETVDDILSRSMSCAYRISFTKCLLLYGHDRILLFICLFNLYAAHLISGDSIWHLIIPIGASS